MMMRMAVAVLLGLAALGTAPADDWPQWLGPKRDGVWREDGIVEQFPAGGPKVLWRKPVAIGYAGPAVAAGKLFLTDRLTPDGKPGKQGSERIRCLDQKTGATLWKHEYDCPYQVSHPAGPRCTP